MKKIGKLRHELRTENMISSESSTYQIIEVVNALVDAHNELLETHTVKEPIVDCSWCRSQMPISADTPIVFHLYGCPNKNIPPSNSEKEEVKEQPTTVKEAFNFEMCPKEPHDHGDDRNIYLRPTTSETKVKISCPDCPHEETDTPEKKPSERIKELEKRLKKDQPNPMDDLVKYSIYCANMKVRAVINYLDELHSKENL